jgi:hypothetical protein
VYVRHFASAEEEVARVSLGRRESGAPEEPEIQFQLAQKAAKSGVYDKRRLLGSDKVPTLRFPQRAAKRNALHIIPTKSRTFRIIPHEASRVA